MSSRLFLSRIVFRGLESTGAGYHGAKEIRHRIIWLAFPSRAILGTPRGLLGTLTRISRPHRRNPMDCRTFRKNHDAFVDDTLPAIDIVAGQRHLLECDECAHYDTTVRRALMVFRNLPTIQPSADFSARLNARLAEARAHPAMEWRQRGPGLGAFAAAALGVVALGYITTFAYELSSPTPALALAPVVAMQPEPVPSPMTSSAIAASMSMGIPAWPAMLMAEQASLQFMNAEYQLTSWNR